MAEFVSMELRQIEQAMLEHIRQCHVAEAVGVPWPDLVDFMPELVWTKTAPAPIRNVSHKVDT